MSSCLFNLFAELSQVEMDFEFEHNIIVRSLSQLKHLIVRWRYCIHKRLLENDVVRRLRLFHQERYFSSAFALRLS